MTPRSAINIERAQVFDPALSGAEDQHVRLEIVISSLPKATHRETLVDSAGETATVTHYSWLRDIIVTESDLEDGEKPEETAAYINSVMDISEGIMPVTVLIKDVDRFWRVFYIKNSKARNIIKQYADETTYEVIPSPPFVEDFQIAWMIADRDRRCVRCINEAPLQLSRTTAAWQTLLPTYKVAPYREVALCQRHSANLVRAAIERRRR